MTECELCKNTYSLNELKCKICGYDFELKSIKDEDACKKYYQKLKNQRSNWVETVEFLGKLQNLVKYSNIQIGKLLGVSRSLICEDIQLFNGLKNCPELIQNTSKKNAFRMLKGIIPKDIFETEEDLHINLYRKWNKTSLAKQWTLVNTGSYMGKFNTNEIGEIDLLAHNKNKDKWLVVELKQRQSSDDTVGQILRYMGWIRKNKAKKNETVEGLIICGEYDLQTEYALICTENLIKVKIYRFHNNEFEFRPFDPNTHLFDLLRSLDPATRNKVLENYNT